MQIWAVGQLNRYLKEIVESDELLQDVWVEGEVSNYVRSSAGHAYFTLKDATTQVRCVLFRTSLARLTYLPQNGDAALVHGRFSLYEPQGQLQIIGDSIRPAGTGRLQLEFTALCARLEREGLFDPARKRPLPTFPRRIGLVTSPTGAAIHDVLTVLGRRWPLVEVCLAPTLVQGDGAPPQICAAIDVLNETDDLDLVIVARGGGSLEDLWPFNDERVARAIYACRFPVVSGVGHEVDLTVADLVADVRAPTPSAAAEIAVPNIEEIRFQLGLLHQRLRGSGHGAVETARERLTQRRATLDRLAPTKQIPARRLAVDELAKRALRSLTQALAFRREQTHSRQLHLNALDPGQVLQRGYSICWQASDGQVIRTVQQAECGQAIRIKVANGVFGANVTGG